MLVKGEEHITKPEEPVPVRLKQYLLLLRSTGKHMELGRIGMAIVVCLDPEANVWMIPKVKIVII